MGKTFRNQAFLHDCGRPWLKHMITDVWTLEPSPDAPCVKSRPINGYKTLIGLPTHPLPLRSHLLLSFPSLPLKPLTSGLFIDQEHPRHAHLLAEPASYLLQDFTQVSTEGDVMLSLDTGLNHLSLSFFLTDTCTHPLALSILFLYLLDFCP